MTAAGMWQLCVAPVQYSAIQRSVYWEQSPTPRTSQRLRGCLLHCTCLLCARSPGCWTPAGPSAPHTCQACRAQQGLPQPRRGVHTAGPGCSHHQRRVGRSWSTAPGLHKECVQHSGALQFAWAAALCMGASQSPPHSMLMRFSTSWVQNVSVGKSSCITALAVSASKALLLCTTAAHCAYEWQT